MPYPVHANPAAAPPVCSAAFTSGMFAAVTAFCRASAAALHVRPSAVHCELQLPPTGAVVHFITSCIVVCAFAVPAHHATVMKANFIRGDEDEDEEEEDHSDDVRPNLILETFA